MTKKFLALLLAVVMVCAMGVIPVSAATHKVAVTIGGVTTPYATLEDAFAAVEADTSGADATITLLDHVELLGYLPSGFTPNTVKVGLYYQVGENLTLDLNGYNITIGSAINEYGLYFRNNTATPYAVTIQNTASTESNIIDNSIAWSTINLNHVSSDNVGPLTLNIGAGVTIKEGDTRVKPTGYESATLCIRKNVTVNIQNGAKLSANKTDYVITGGVDTETKNATNTLNIFDGATVAHEGAGNAILSVGTVNISGGTITAKGGSALYPAGTSAQDYNIVYNVSGGTITSENTVITTNQDKVTFNITGGTLTGDVALNAAEEGAGSALNITGGKLTGDVEANNNAAVSVGGEAVVTGDLNTKAGATSEIKGGTVGSVTVASGAEATISGGTVNGKVEAQAGSSATISGEGVVGSVTVASGAEATISGGTIADLTVADGAKTTVSGGTIKGEVTVSNDNKDFAVTGGTFEDKDAQTFIKDNYLDNDVEIDEESGEVLLPMYATFRANGKTIDTVPYYEGQTELSKIPAVPAKEGYYGYWEAYELKDGGITVNAIYIKIPERSRVSFVADGRLVGIILYRANQDELTVLPKVPAKEGYVGTWAEYTLTGKNMIVRAVYTPIAE